MIEKTKQLVESKYTLENGYNANAKVRVWSHLPILQVLGLPSVAGSGLRRHIPFIPTLAGGLW